MSNQLRRSMFIIAGLLACLCGIFGVVLPLVPTTPFLLLSAFCFSKSSNTLYQWLLSQPLLGGVINDWEQSGVIALKTKVIACTSLIAMVAAALLIGDYAYWTIASVTTVSILVLSFIWSRPSQV
ncbi:YbaN family protein [Alteromonas sp. CYL-A6]|uniref:YbaN family protein n=1 Tax=Alteromonas nitratireducens TaxID=3390813 RepID=UPI0034BAC23B